MRIAQLLSQSRAYLFMIKDLEGIPGTEAVRKRAYTRLLNDFRGFVNSVRQLGEHKAELATALYHMGALQCEMQEWSPAYASLTEAEQLLREQVVKEPKRLEHRLNLARCMTSLGLVESQRGNTELAEKLGSQAVELLDGLAQSLPHSSDLTYDQAKAANSLAKLWQRIEKNQAAADLLGRTIHQLEQDIDRWPEHTELKEILFYAYNNLASVLASSAPERATELYQHAVDIQTQICKVDDRVRPSADLALALTNLGRAHASEQHIEAAREAYAKAHEINNLVRQLAPSNSEFIRNFSINLNNLAMAERRAGDLPAAERRLREAVHCSKVSAKTHRTTLNWNMS